MITTVNIELSKRGLPCLWEEGGAGSNTGSCTIIGDMNCRPKKPIYVATRGHLSNGDHALIPVRTNDIIVKCSQWRYDYTINIYKIVSFNLEEKEATLEPINSFDKGEWDFDLPKKYIDIVETAKNKATSYHCRTPYFIKEEKNEKY